jgi:uncharacterized protein (TIGR02301 family)
MYEWYVAYLLRINSYAGRRAALKSLRRSAKRVEPNAVCRLTEKPATCRQRFAKRFMRNTIFAALIMMATCGLGTARAQDVAAPFDGDLQRLAEILGALHYLRGICGSNEGLKWRNEMQALVDAETPSGDRRARMIAGFNRGYNGFQQTYRTCTPAAGVAIRRYIEEGSKISRDLTARYAN